MRLRRWAAALALTFAVPPASAARNKNRNDETVVASVADMANDGEAQTMVQGKGLPLLNVLWEDTARRRRQALGSERVRA